MVVSRTGTAVICTLMVVTLRPERCIAKHPRRPTGRVPPQWSRHSQADTLADPIRAGTGLSSCAMGAERVPPCAGCLTT